METRMAGSRHCPRDAVFAIAATNGYLWRKHRRVLGRDVQEPLLDLLVACGQALRPSKNSCVANIKEAKTEVRTLAAHLVELAKVPTRSRPFEPPPVPPPLVDLDVLPGAITCASLEALLKSNLKSARAPYT